MINLALFLLIIFSVVSLIIPHKSPDDTGEGVQRDITRLYRRNLLNLLNKIDDNIDPCENFFEHVCNGHKPVENRSGIHWNKNQRQRSFARISADEDDEEDIPPFLYNKEDRMRFFEEKIYDFKTEPGELLRGIYQDCKSLHRYDVEIGPAKPRWTRMLNEISFLARRSYIYRQWPFQHFEWVTLYRRYKLSWIVLSAKFAAHGLPSLLNIFFAEGTIYIESAVKSKSCPSLFEVEESLRPLVGQRQTAMATELGRELWNFCNVLNGDFELEYAMEYNDTQSLEELYFQTFFTTLNFTESEIEQARHIPIDLVELQRLLQLLLNANPRIVFNYVLWHAYMELDYKDCYMLTQEFEDMLFSEYWNWSNIFAKHFSRNVAMASYIYQTTRFQKLRRQIHMSYDWDKFFFQKLVRRDFNIERLIRNYSSMYLDTAYLMETYGETSLVQGNFFGNLLSLRRAKLRASFYQQLVDEENLNHPQYFLRQFLYFSIMLLKQPIFHYFATQGFELWYASNLLYTTDGYLTALDCMERQSFTHIIDNANHADDDDDDGPGIYAILKPAEIQEIYRFHSAFSESYRDYRFWLSGEFFAFAEDFVLEYFRMDSHRILFYATAQLYCNRNDPLYSSLINRSFMNSYEFAMAFNCSEEDSAMHPIVKCMNKV